MPGCQKLQMTAYPGLAQDELPYPYGNSGRQRVKAAGRTARFDVSVFFLLSSKSSYTRDAPIGLHTGLEHLRQAPLS